jgi:type 1 fimbria pilin
MKPLALILTILANAVAAQSILPPCDPNVASTSWTNCQGTYTWANGDKYVGEFREGKQHGQGTYTYVSGNKYVGEHRDGKAHGQGTATYANGDKYVGEHRDGKAHGQGTYTAANGDKYVGGFREGNKHGEGIYYFLADNQFKGDRYIGGFRDDKRNGQGTYTFTNGIKYVGEWRDNKYHGQGILIYADGRPPLEGVWEDNKFVRAESIPDHIAGRSPSTPPPVLQTPRQAEPPRSTLSLSASAYGQSALPPCDPKLAATSWTNCLGIIIYANGDEYVGEFSEGEPHGRGIRIYTDVWAPQEGIWERGRFVRAERIPDHIVGYPSTPLPAAKAPRQAEHPRPPMLLTISSSQPDANGVITFSITTNGDTASLRVNGDEEGSSADGRYNVRRFAQIGETQFEVIATDRFGNTKKQKVSVFRDAVASTVKFPPLNPSNVRARPATNAVAIIIGIQDYRRVPKAEFANNDARLFYDYAVRGLGVKPENIKLLLDQEADDVGILGAIQNWLPLKARKGQTDVYVFYSGHGLPSDDGGSLYLLPHGVDRQFLDRTAIKQSELVSALQAANPKSVTLFMDACYSGQIRTGETLLASARPISIQPKASTFPSNFTVLSASAPEQIASSSPDLKHGIFSYYLMKGMEGEADQNKDGRITVQEMHSYLEDSVGRKAMALNRTQQPQVVGDQSRVLVER